MKIYLKDEEYMANSKTFIFRFVNDVRMKLMIHSKPYAHFNAVHLKYMKTQHFT